MFIDNSFIYTHIILLLITINTFAGLFCSSSSIIQCPMFPFHLKMSKELMTASNVKKNIVLIDEDAKKDITPYLLQDALRKKGIADAEVLVHEFRKRHDVPALYAKTKVSYKTVSCFVFHIQMCIL